MTPRPPRSALASTRGIQTRGDAVAIDRAFATLFDEVQRLAADSISFVDVDLANGVNRIDHNLDRPVSFVWLVKTTTAPGFDFAFDPAQASNPIPRRQVWIEVVGGPARARLIFA